MQYSLAIVRLVNGVSDSSQKGRVAASVASLADQAGLPRLLVDLRHEATHNELPSLSPLRVAAVQGLAWLKQRYWNAQREHRAIYFRKIGDALNKYVGSHISAASKGFTGPASQLSQHEEQTVDEQRDAYDLKKERKYRQALFTELKTLVPKGAESLLAQALLQQVVIPELPAEVVENGTRQALRLLLNEWIDIGAFIVKITLDTCFRRLIYEDSSPALHYDTWLQSVVHLMDGSTVESVVEATMNTYSRPLQKKQMEWFVKGKFEGSHGDTRHDDAMASCRKKMTMLQEKIKDRRTQHACCAFTQRRLIIPREVEDIGEDDSCDIGDIKKEESKSDAPPLSSESPWKRVRRWKPCAIGLLPSSFDNNGTVPLLHNDAPESTFLRVEPLNLAEPESRYDVGQPGASASYPHVHGDSGYSTSNTSGSIAASQEYPDDDITSGVGGHEAEGACPPPASFLEKGE